MCSAVALVLPTAPQIYGHKLSQSVPLLYPPYFLPNFLSILNTLFLMMVKNSWIDLTV